jgi:hypothetical protein
VKLEARDREHVHATGPAHSATGGLVLGCVLVVLVGAVLPALIAQREGALALPRSDDWSYLLSLFRWVDDGTLAFNNWAGTTLIGQLAVAAPVAAVFPRSITAVHLASAVMSGLGLLAIVALCRPLLRDAWAVGVALTIAAGPLWLAVAPTFMTDNWAFGFQILGIALAFEAFRRRDPVHVGWFAASLAAGFVAIAIRQYALVPVVACSIVAVGRAVAARHRSTQRQLAGLLALTAVAVAVLLGWWIQRPTLDTLPMRVPDVERVRATVQLDLGYLRLLGLLLAPVVALAGPVRIVRRALAASRGATAAVVVVAGGALALEQLRYPELPFVGNYVTRSGVLGLDVLTGARPDVLPRAVYELLVWGAAASAVVILLAAVPVVVGFRREGMPWSTLVGTRDPVAAVCGWCFVGFALVFTGIGLAHLPKGDRYILPVLPLVAISLLRASARDEAAAASRSGLTGTPAGATVGAVIALAVLFVVGLAFAAESAAFDATRWEVAERAVRATGLAPTQVDGGFEWVAWHRRTGPPVSEFLADSERRTVMRAYRAPFCVVVAVDPHVPRERIVAQGVARAPTRTDARIVAYRLDKDCAPAR